MNTETSHPACLAFVASLAFTLFGCQGYVDGVSRPRGSDLGTGGALGSGGTLSSGGSAGTAPILALGQCTEPDRRLERLSHDQYDRTLRDLLGDESQPGAAFPADVNNSKSFANNADGASISPLLAEAYEASATRVLASAWQADAARVASGQAPYLRSCELGGGGEAATCARAVLERFSAQAFRRPVSTSEVDGLMSVYEKVLALGETSEGSLMAALRVVLLSPEFLFRINRLFMPASAPAEPVLARLDDHALATRLAYFAWGSTPDLVLTELAQQGKLQADDVWHAQVERVLGDSRADALVQDFFEVWLDTPRVLQLDRDAGLFPSFDGELRRLFREETSLFAKAFLREDLDARDLLDAGFSFVNDRLAAHYGLPPVGSTALVRASSSGSPRGGLLGQGSVLSLTSLATRTSPVRRGKWVLERLLCSEMPDPPPDVDTNPPPVAPSLTLRARLEQHRQDPACAGCHDVLDPIGFGLESYDAVGSFRALDNGVPIDTSSSLGEGASFANAAELVALLRSDPRLGPCLAEKAYSYAAARTLRPEDEDEIHALSAGFEAAGYRWARLLQSVASSERFRSVCVAPL